MAQLQNCFLITCVKFHWLKMLLKMQHLFSIPSLFKQMGYHANILIIWLWKIVKSKLFHDVLVLDMYDDLYAALHIFPASSLTDPHMSIYQEPLQI